MTTIIIISKPPQAQEEPTLEVVYNDSAVSDADLISAIQSAQQSSTNSAS